MYIIFFFIKMIEKWLKNIDIKIVIKLNINEKWIIFKY
jgi:hypothetical protein